MSVSSCILNGVFIYFKLQVLISVCFCFHSFFPLLFILDSVSLTRSDNCLFKCSHKSYSLEKIGKRMIVKKNCIIRHVNTVQDL